MDVKVRDARAEVSARNEVVPGGRGGGDGCSEYRYQHTEGGEGVREHGCFSYDTSCFSASLLWFRNTRRRNMTPAR